MNDFPDGIGDHARRMVEAAKDRSGFEPLEPQEKMCRDPGHQPPTHMVIPPDMKYRHVCPACGKTSVIYPSRISW